MPFLAAITECNGNKHQNKSERSSTTCTTSAVFHPIHSGRPRLWEHQMHTLVSRDRQVVQVEKLRPSFTMRWWWVTLSNTYVYGWQCQVQMHSEQRGTTGHLQRCNMASHNWCYEHSLQHAYCQDGPEACHGLMDSMFQLGMASPGQPSDTVKKSRRDINFFVYMINAFLKVQDKNQSIGIRTDTRSNLRFSYSKI